MMKGVSSIPFFRVRPFETAKGKIHHDFGGSPTAIIFLQRISTPAPFGPARRRSTMSIRCVCQNGHVLKVKDSFAGKSGRCPSCNARVDVPISDDSGISEDAILGLLGKQSQSDRVTAESSGVLLAASESGTLHLPFPKKTCSRCEREVTVGTHICPHCHTYIANLSDF
jgi:hypothetical protein